MRSRPPVSSILLLSALSGCGGCSKHEANASDGSAAPAVTTIADAMPVNVTAVPTASVAAFVNPQHLPAYAGPTGSVEGTISVTGDRAPATPADFSRCPAGTETFGRAFREGEPKTPDGPRWLADAIVAVTGYGDFYIPEKEEAEAVDIKGCAFAKRTITMTFGQRLEVKNLSREFWTPLLQPSGTTVMMMATPGGDPVKLYPKKPGRYMLVDHDRKYAVTDVFVLLQPLHTTSGVLGNYRIDGVPAGKVKVNTTHPRIENAEASTDVEVKPGVVVRVDLTLSHKATAASPKQEDAGDYHPPLH